MTRARSAAHPAHTRPAPPRAQHEPLDPSWLPAFYAASADRLREFTPQQAARTLWALARVRAVPPAAWMDAFLDASHAGIRGLGARRAFEASAFGLLRLQCAPASCLARPRVRGAECHARSRACCIAQSLKHTAHVPFHPLHAPPTTTTTRARPDVKSMSLTLWALATLCGLGAPRPGRAWLAAFEAHAEAGVKHLGAAEAATALWALAQLTGACVRACDVCVRA